MSKSKTYVFQGDLLDSRCGSTFGMVVAYANKGQWDPCCRPRLDALLYLSQAPPILT